MSITIEDVKITNCCTYITGIFHMDIICDIIFDDKKVTIETDVGYLADNNPPLEFGDVFYYDKYDRVYLECNDYDEVTDKLRIIVNGFLKERGII